MRGTCAQPQMFCGPIEPRGRPCRRKGSLGAALAVPGTSAHGGGPLEPAAIGPPGRHIRSRGVRGAGRGGRGGVTPAGDAGWNALPGRGRRRPLPAQAWITHGPHGPVACGSGARRSTAACFEQPTPPVGSQASPAGGCVFVASRRRRSPAPQRGVRLDRSGPRKASKTHCVGRRGWLRGGAWAAGPSRRHRLGKGCSGALWRWTHTSPARPPSGAPPSDAATPARRPPPRPCCERARRTRVARRPSARGGR